MNIQKIIITVFCYVALSYQSAFAAIITASATNISGNIWESRYTIENPQNSGSTIYWFTIYFDQLKYDDLEFIRTDEIDSDWDVFVAEPPLLGPDWFVDALSYGAGIAEGQSLTNFLVRYRYLGTDLPGVQTFEIYDPAVDEPVPIGSGTVNTSVVSEPHAILIFGLGLIALVVKRRLLQSTRI